MMGSLSARSARQQRVDALDGLLLSAYKLFRTLSSSIGLNQSSFGRKLVGSINTVGTYVTRGVLRLVHPKVSVRGRQMVLAGQRGPSAAYSLDMILGRYEPEVAAWFERVVKPGMTVLDIGGHIGFYTLLAAELVGNTGRVFAFEPEAENFAVLSKNVAAAKYANVQLLQKAVTDKVGEIQLFISSQGNDRHSVYENPRSILAEPHVNVASTSIDRFLEAAGWPRVDVIKMDIEGAEPLAIEGMTELLSRSDRLLILIEFAPELLDAAGTAPDQFLRRLADVGFHITCLREDGTREYLNPAQFSQFSAEVRGATNLVCDWKQPTARESSLKLSLAAYSDLHVGPSGSDTGGRP